MIFRPLRPRLNLNIDVSIVGSISNLRLFNILETVQRFLIDFYLDFSCSLAYFSNILASLARSFASFFSTANYLLFFYTFKFFKFYFFLIVFRYFSIFLINFFILF